MSKIRSAIRHGAAHHLVAVHLPSLCCLIAGLALTAGAMVPADAATLSQEPLASRSSVPPKPNVVFTVDDSGSMQTHYMPEGRFLVNGYTVNFPGGELGGYYMTDGFPGDTTHISWVPDAVMTARKEGSESVYQMQYRSPEVNDIFYNPDVRYQPWWKSTGVRFPQAVPSAARWDPTATATYDLTTARTYTDEFYWAFSYDLIGHCYEDMCPYKFHPGLVYRLTGTDPTLKSSYTRYDINSTGTDFAAPTKHANRTDCARSKCSQAEERQNFANWFTYYRTRMLLTKASISEVLAATGDAVRVGMASINTGVFSGNAPKQSVDGQMHAVMRKGVRDLSAAQRDLLLSDLQSMIPVGSTPLKRAIEEVGKGYYMRTGPGSPWRDDPDPGSKSAAEAQCRRSYNILMTDGYYNLDSAATLTPGNADGVNGPSSYPPDPRLSSVPTAYGYQPAAPYADSTASTLADFAMHFYVTDLQPTISNRVQPDKSRTKAPYWQHMTTFTVGLGVKGSLDSRSEPLNADGKSPKELTLAAIRSGAVQWPYAVDTNEKKIDDLWHAAVNTGGDFFSVKNSVALTNAMVAALGSAISVTRSEGGVGATSSTLTSGALKFVPGYRSSNWNGDLNAYKLGTQGGRFVFGAEPVWVASKNVPAAAARNLYTYDGTAGVTFGTGMSEALRNLVTTATTQASMINYLRGDKSSEGDSAPAFRRRSGPLPDFVNSTPVFVKGMLDAGYSKLPGTEGGSYAAFLARKSARKGVVYVGGNGGFLHGFDENNGKELFGYAPKAVLPNMNVLTLQTYGTSVQYHQYFVDGPMIEADAFIPTAGNRADHWTNLLIGTLGAGGRAIYGLDVTDPTQLGTNTVQWEFAGSEYPNIGNIFSAPEVGRLKGRWMAFFGNGAHSSKGHAVLLAVDLKDRSLMQFELDAASTDNGLMGVKLQLNAQNEVQAAYAGDLKGNLWRIDFENSASSASWKKGFGGSPLYVAKDSGGKLQPISVKPTIFPHSSGGHLVTFGTGKLFDEEDASKTHAAATDPQSFYSVWDRTPSGQSAAGSDASSWSGLANQRSKLTQQVISKAGSGKDEGHYNVTDKSVDWATQRGWYMDLDIDPGQRVVYPSVPVSDYVLIQTVVPGAKPNDCEDTSGTGYDFLLPAATGAQKGPVWDSNGDGKVDKQDSTGAGYQGGADGANAVMTSPDDSRKGKSIGSNSDKDFELPSSKKKITDRVWREIVNPPRP